MWHYSIIVLLLPLVLQGQDPDYIMFPHTLHVDEMEIECGECHDGVNMSNSLTTRLLPSKDFCLDCHDGDIATEDCEACHSNPDEPSTYRKLPVRPGPSFSHVLHLNKVSDCLECHGYISYDDGFAPPILWRGQDCRACHEELPPESHTLDWITSHGSEVNLVTVETCNLCHAEPTCDACHQLQQFEPKVHPLAYIQSHGFDARSGITECSSCHEIVTDCRSCHNQQQVMPMDHNLAGWVSLPGFGDGGLHAMDALEMPDVCIACHEPETGTCQRCHAEVTR